MYDTTIRVLLKKNNVFKSAEHKISNTKCIDKKNPAKVFHCGMKTITTYTNTNCGDKDPHQPQVKNTEQTL